MKAGLIGLGHMGRAIAERLVREGVRLTVWNRTPSKAEGLGAMVAASPSAVVSKNDVVILNLFDSASVEEVLRSPGGILEGGCAGKIILDTTTNDFSSVEVFYGALREKGAAYIEGPLLGSIPLALSGTLTVLISGERWAYEKALPIIGKFGKEVFYLEKPALATKMKLVNNLLLGAFMAAIAEAASIAESSGADKALSLEIFSKGAGASAVLSAKKEYLLKDGLPVQFKANLMYKDLHYLQDLARSLGKPLFTGSIVKELYALALSKGLGEADFSSVYKVFKGQ